MITNANERRYRAHLTRVSSNAKTGPIPVSVTERACCSKACPFLDNGCYGEYGPLSLHWRKVSEGKRGVGWSEFCGQVAQLPAMQLWRHDQAGDLPGDGVIIDYLALDELVVANSGKRGFTYTHYDATRPENQRAIIWANVRGFRVNLSANNLTHADALFDLDIAPVVTVLPDDQTTNCVTPKGRRVVVCPATQREDVTCATCQLCQHQRETIVGFPAHGTGYKKVNIAIKESQHA